MRFLEKLPRYLPLTQGPWGVSRVLLGLTGISVASSKVGAGYALSRRQGSPSCQVALGLLADHFGH